VKDDAHEVGLLEQKPRAALTGLPRELDGLGELGSRYFKILAAGTRSMSLRARYVRLRRAVPPAHDP